MKKTTTKNGITELVFLLDRSGSMNGLEPDTIGGFNAMLEKQKKEPGIAYVSTVLFDDRSEVLHDRVPLSGIQPMTDRDYTVRGCTALLDAIGDAIHHIETIHKYARPEDVPEHTLFVITTDGMENASQRYCYKEIKKTIQKKQKQCGWEFLFIGANIDAISVASMVGIAPNRAANYRADKRGTDVMWKNLCAPISAVRCNAAIDNSWSENMEADNKKR